MKKILITGASGFIGGFLVKEALSKGYETWAAIRKTSSRENLQDKRIKFIYLNFDNTEKLFIQLADHVKQHGKWDYIIHNLGITKAFTEEEFIKANVYCLMNILVFLTKSKNIPSKMLLMSSLSAYGNVHNPISKPITTESPQDPDSFYGFSKLEAEMLLRRVKEVPHVIFNPTGVYGPCDMDYLMEMQSIQRGFDFKAGLRTQHLSFIYVKDLARAAILALESKKTTNRSYCVSDRDAYTDRQFASLIAELLGKKFLLQIPVPLLIVRLACIISGFIGRIKGKPATLNPDKYRILRPRNWTCDSTPLWNDLQTTPAYNLRQGLIETIKWYREKKLLK
jgi:nucleoside-diphosphate-sugar epimerase